jgi:uncharacterized protein
MKYLDPRSLQEISESPIQGDKTFSFHCHAALDCFTQCCRNLNLILYPYDVLRLKNSLGVTSDAFIEEHVDIVLREGRYFPDVLLRMADDDRRSCPFMVPEGCRVYADRPHTCRTFPVEQGVLFGDEADAGTPVGFLRPPSFCRGCQEGPRWTLQTWNEDQQALRHHDFNLRWSQVHRLFDTDPWGAEGPQGPKARMAFMAVYNLDRFREFVFKSSFLKRFRIQTELSLRLRRSDEALLTFGYEWIRLFVWGQPSRAIRPRS